MRSRPDRSTPLGLKNTQLTSVESNMPKVADPDQGDIYLTDNPEKPDLRFPMGEVSINQDQVATEVCITTGTTFLRRLWNLLSNPIMYLLTGKWRL